ncbi:hypothetical protein HDU81_004987, partial [Chytriomyces hyalinus]
TRPVASDTRPSRDTLSTVSVFVVVAVRDLLRREQSLESQPLRVLPSLSTRDLTDPPLRSVLDASAETCAFSTPTGSTRTPPSNSTKLSSSTHNTRPSAVMPVSTGSLLQCTSTVKAVVSPPSAKRTVVSERVTDTTRPSVEDAERTGSAATPSPSVVTV